MKTMPVGEKLHLFIEALPVTKQTEIYYSLKAQYRDEFKSALRENFNDEEMSANESELVIQQLLS